MPDKFESGSHNAIGLAGLSEGVAWILKKSVAALWQHDQTLCKVFMTGVEGVDGLQYFGPQGIRNRMGVFSVRIRGMEPARLADVLEKEFGILTRPGLHCAPLAHTHLGTVTTGGTTRLSFGPFLNIPDIEYVANALAAVALRDLATA